MGRKEVKNNFPSLKLFFFCLAFLSGKFLFSQQIIITGKVTDSIGKPLENVNVLVQSQEDEIIFDFDFTDPKGVYHLELEQPGEYDLEFRSMGYETIRIDISEALGNIQKLQKDVILKDKNEILEEVVIQAESNIQVKKDTITISADAFRTGNEEVLEDLFKNIPGLSIGKDGTIKVGNKSIEKVMVEGDDFFGRGYKLLTKNMDPNTIEKVEIYHNYSSNKLLKDIENSDKVALNVTLKEDNKYEWFGNLSAGYNALLQDRHIGRLNLMSFGKKNKFYLLSTLNNLGIDSKGSLSDLIKTSEDELVSNLGENITTYSYYHSNSEHIPYFDNTRVSFNDSRLISLNGIFNLTEKVKLKILAFSHWDNRDFVRSSIRRYQLERSDITIKESFQSEDQDFDSFLKMQLDYDISSRSSFKFLSIISHSNRKSFSDFYFKNKNSYYETNENNNLLDQVFSYTYKIGTKEVLDISGRVIDEESPQFFSTNETLLQSFLKDENFKENISQIVNQTVRFRGIEANYYNRFSEKSLLEIKSGFLNSENYLESYLQGTSDDSDVFENDLLYKTQEFYIVPKYATTWKNLTLSGALGISQYLRQLTLDYGEEKKRPFVINPQIGLNWQINGTNKILTQYAHSINYIDLPNIAPSYIIRDYRSLAKGTPRLAALEASRVLINYTSGNWGDRFFANVFFNYTKRNDYLSTRSIITSEVEKTEKILFENQDLFNLSSSMDQYLDFLSSNLKLKTSYSTTAFESFVNNKLIGVEAENYSLGFEFKTAFSADLNFHLGSEWMRSNILSTENFRTTQNFSFVDLMYTPNNRLNLSLRTEAYKLTDTFSDSDLTYFLNFNARYSVLKNKLSLQFHGQNLTNTKNYINAFSNELGTVETTYRLIPRYLLLKLDYRF